MHYWKNLAMFSISRVSWVIPYWMHVEVIAGKNELQKQSLNTSEMDFKRNPWKNLGYLFNTPYSSNWNNPWFWKNLWMIFWRIIRNFPLNSPEGIWNLSNNILESIVKWILEEFQEKILRMIHKLYQAHIWHFLSTPGEFLGWSTGRKHFGKGHTTGTL